MKFLSDSAELINQLDTLYPHKCPGPLDDPRLTAFYAGKRELIDDLLTILEESRIKNGPGQSKNDKLVEKLDQYVDPQAQTYQPLQQSSTYGLVDYGGGEIE